MSPSSIPCFRLLLLLMALMIAGCNNSSGGSSTSEIVVSWDANRESGVNSTGGGYRVYHSTTSGFDIGSAEGVVDVSHTSGTTPTSTTLSLPPGMHYIKVVAYSALNPSGSATSEEVAVFNLF